MVFAVYLTNSKLEAAYSEFCQELNTAAKSIDKDGKLHVGTVVVRSTRAAGSCTSRAIMLTDATCSLTVRKR